ncbi:uncharacterized protein FA14DRAFT_192113 [Meira miltonrushii]|uniref:DBF4-type domain-containing protein n=1 Tax=Meira miltonrushii TaxID=1280837 RepID=A0A316V9G7_9BASI|nr:uncharacterized protein FA14DRAFT_192113 [Meira miltonrushii]PWN33081.1 hypothetical protein FA14DRAFT_192113 [Meira miltonrushii]
MSRPFHSMSNHHQSSASKGSKDTSQNEYGPSSVQFPKPAHARQPFGNKNTANSPYKITTEEVEMISNDGTKKKSPILTKEPPNPKANTPKVSTGRQEGSAPTKTASPGSRHQSSLPHSNRYLAPLSGSQNIYGRYGASAYAAHAPSPLSHNQHQQTEEQENEEEIPQKRSTAGESALLSPSAVKTPRKRAIPLEDVHARNIVGRNTFENAKSPNPHKRSKSSHNGSSTAGGSTSTSLGISAAIDEVHLEESSTAESIPSTNRASLKDKKPATSTVAKTIRIDKQSRISPSDRIKREENKSLSTMEWRKKFLRAFPSFRFYLDGFDQATKVDVSNTIAYFGGQLEPFFSNTVTHLVTQRKFSIPLVDEQGEVIGTQGESLVHTESATSASASGRSLMGAGRFSRLPTLRKKNANVPLHSERNPFDEMGPPVSANDILVKAKNFGIKVWTFEKFKTVMSGLKGEHTVDSKKQPNLSQMLAKEKVYGTQERDPKAARSDYHYFSRNSIYLLVEDATAEHRPIMAQEWRKPAREDEEVPWPVLYGELEGRCPFTRFQLAEGHQQRTRPNRFETLQRSVSLNHVRKQNRNASLSPAPSNDSRSRYTIARGASPYPLASGNSVSIASTNLTSTTSAAPSHSANALGLMSPFHPLGRKAHQATAIGMGRPSSLPRSFGQHFPDPAQQQDQARVSIVNRMLGITDTRSASELTKAKKSMNPISRTIAQTGGMRRSASTGTRLQEYQREKRPGYCENCRQKYEDFDDHVLSKRHRKFAQDDGNFDKIDELLLRVLRPIATWALRISTNVGGVNNENDQNMGDEFIEEPFSDIDSEQSPEEKHGSPGSRVSREQSVHRTPQMLNDVVQSWQREAANTTGDDIDQEDQDLIELERHVAEAAAAFRIRTGVDQHRSPQYGTDVGEDTVGTSPNAPSYGIGVGTGGMDDSMTTTISPHTSPQMKHREVHQNQHENDIASHHYHTTIHQQDEFGTHT